MGLQNVSERVGFSLHMALSIFADHTGMQGTALPVL